MIRKWFHSALLLLLAAAQAWAVDYQLPDIDGQTKALDQYQGKWVIVNYWATWCNTCMKELPDLISFHEKYKDRNAVVVGINFEEINMEELGEFVKEKSIPYLVLHSKPVPITPLGRVPALPTTYIIDPEGKVIAGDVGLVTQQNIEDYIASKTASKIVAEDNSDEDDAS